MPRKKTPTAVLDARNAFKKHPERKRDGEPKVTAPVGAVPAGLSKEERAAWQTIVSEAPPGVLTEADRVTVTIAAKLLAEAGDFVNMPTSRVTLLNKLLGQFGMNPSDRASLNIPQAPKKNPFTEGRKRRGSAKG